VYWPNFVLAPLMKVEVEVGVAVSAELAVAFNELNRTSFNTLKTSTDILNCCSLKVRKDLERPSSMEK
jgi:hypothetical protein